MTAHGRGPRPRPGVVAHGGRQVGQELSSVGGDRALSLRAGVPAGGLRFGMALSAAAILLVGVGQPGSVRAQEADSLRLPGASPAYEFRNGRWFDGEGFRPGTFYTRFGTLTRTRPAGVDSVVDLKGRWVVPPYAEGHNHNVEDSPRLEGLIDRYLRAGVYYVKNPNALPRSALAIRDRVNLPASIDASFAMGGWTSPGGHPIGVVRRAVGAGFWPEGSGDGAFYYAVENEEHLDRRWAGFLALRPDFVKTYLLYSENHAEIRDDTAHVGWRGLDPALLPEIVRRAHAADLPVTAHVETAADFGHAVAAGVDEVAHLPGFRGDRSHLFPDPAVYRIREADARLAGERGIVVLTTLANYEGSAPDSVTRAAHEVWIHNLSLLKRHGVSIALGSDGYDGVGVAEAFQVLDLGVFSPAELLRAWVETTPATIFPGRRIGRLEEGFEASFLVLDGDPLEDFSATREIVLRVKNGLILDPGPEPEPSEGTEGSDP